MKEGIESDILLPQNESDCVSENLDFENFPGEHAPGPPRGTKKFWHISPPKSLEPCYGIVG